jgi:putative ABC transport system permease protein
MRRVRRAWLRLAGTLSTHHTDRDLDDELAYLVDLKTDDYMRTGLPRDEARRQALMSIGGVESVKQAVRDQRAIPLIESTLFDIRFGLRVLRRHRAHALLAITTLALGIGVTAAMFGILDAVVLRPFGVPDPDRLVIVRETNTARGIDTFPGSAANYVDWRANTTSFAELAAWEMRPDNRTDGPQPERVQSAVASAPFFRALRVTPRLGRFFRDDEDTPAARHVVVLGYEYWQRAFAADPNVAGRVLTINGEAHTVIGVAPPLRAPFTADWWRPLAPDLATLDRGSHHVTVMGRLAPGHGITSAEAELRTVAARLAAEYPESNRGWSVRIEPIYDAFVSTTTRRAMGILLAAVALLLLMACVNVAGLTLARAPERTRELAMRFALGAARVRLARQLFTEGAVVAVLSATAGIVVAMWLLDTIKWLFPADVRGLSDATLSPGTIGAAVAVAAVSTTMASLIPAFESTREAARAEHLGARTATSGPRLRSLRAGFVVAQVALSLMLLVASGLLLTSLNRLVGVPLGFGTEAVATARLTLDDNRFDSMTAYTAHVDRLLGVLSTQPGVAAAGISTSVPFDGAYTVMQVRRTREESTDGRDGESAQWRVIGGEYFAALRLPLLRGRTFVATDDASVPRVTVISDGLARRMFGDLNPLDREIIVGDARRPYRVIGVVGAARLTALDKEPEPTMYFHYRQFGWPTLTIAVRAAGSPGALAGVIRTAVASVDPSQPVFDERAMSDVVHAAAAAPRLNAGLLTSFALLALALATIGVYGVMSVSAAQRMREMSLRLVLGAPRSAVFVLLYADGFRLTALGAITGIAGSLLTARAFEAVLYQVSAFDPFVYGVSLAVVLGVAVLACVVPAVRATRADPVRVLRQE